MQWTPCVPAPDTGRTPESVERRELAGQRRPRIDRPHHPVHNDAGPDRARDVGPRPRRTRARGRRFRSQCRVIRFRLRIRDRCRLRHLLDGGDRIIAQRPDRLDTGCTVFHRLYHWSHCAGCCRVYSGSGSVAGRVGSGVQLQRGASRDRRAGAAVAEEVTQGDSDGEWKTVTPRYS